MSEVNRNHGAKGLIGDVFSIVGKTILSVKVSPGDANGLVLRFTDGSRICLLAVERDGESKPDIQECSQALWNCIVDQKCQDGSRYVR